MSKLRFEGPEKLATVMFVVTLVSLAYVKNCGRSNGAMMEADSLDRYYSQRIDSLEAVIDSLPRTLKNKRTRKNSKTSKSKKNARAKDSLNPKQSKRRPPQPDFYNPLDHEVPTQ